MRRILFSVFILGFCTLIAEKSFAQPYIAPGTYSIPGTVTLTNATTISVTTIGTTIDALNTYGVPNAGTVQFNFADNYTETATATNGVGIGFYTLGSTTSGPGSALYSTNYTAVIFKHNGTGVKPKLNAYAGATASATDYIIRLLSVNNITFDGFDLLDNGSTASMEYGFKIETSTTGSSNDTIANCKIILNRGNYVSTGIYQTNSLASGGSNKYNTFDKDTIYDAYRGIFMNGNSVAADIGNVVKRCVIGDAVFGGGDIGSNVSLGSATFNATYGISIDYQQDVTIAQNQIRNVTYFGKGVSAPSAAGLYATNVSGTSYIQQNDIHSIKVGTASTSCNAYGIYLSGSSGTSYIHTNFISDIVPPSSGSSSLHAWGIYLPGSTAGGNTVGVYNNSINFASQGFTGTSGIYTNTTCLEIGDGSVGSSNGPTVDVKDNLFSTINQKVNGSKKFFGIIFTSGTLTSSYNMFGGSSGIYYTGQYGATLCSTVAAWNTASGQDAPAVSNNTVPGFTSATDPHLNFITPNPLYQGVFITTPSITEDIDTVFKTMADPLLYPYMGADQFTNQTGIIISANQPSDSIVNQTSSPQVLAGMIFLADGVSTTFTGLTVNTSGSYIPTSTTDFSKFQLWIGSSPTFNSGTFTLVGAATAPTLLRAPAIGGAITFGSFAIPPTITSGSVYYIFVTDSVGATATVGDNIGVTTTAFSNITFTGGVSKIGTDPVAASGFQRIAKFFYNYGNAYGTNYADITSVNGWYESTTGVQPIEFDLPYQVFQFIHNGSVMADSTGYTSWTVSGTGAKIIVGDGVNTITFPAKWPVITSGGAVIDVLDKGVLKLQGEKYMTGVVFGTLNQGTAATPGSTVEYGDSGLIANQDTLASAPYCNLTLSGITTGGATRVFPSSLSVSRVFTPGGFTQPTPLKGNIVFNGALVTQTIPTGFLFRGLKINNTVGPTLLAGDVSVDSLLYIKTGGLTIASGQTLTLTPNASDTIPAIGAPVNVLQVNGSFTNNNPAYTVFKTIQTPATQQTLLQFAANSNYNLSAALGGTTGGQIPSATWASNSNINITNVTSVNVNPSLDAISAGAPTATGFGNIYFDAPALSASALATGVYSLFSGFTYVGSGKTTSPYIITLQGNLVLGRTNGLIVGLTNTVTSAPSTNLVGMNIFIGGNLVQYAGSYLLNNNTVDPSAANTNIKNIVVSGKDSINGSTSALLNPLYGTTGYTVPIFDISSAAGAHSIGNLSVAGDFIMTGSSTIQQSASPANLIFNGSTGNQNAQFQTISHNTKFTIEVNKTQVSGGADTVKLLSAALADSLYLTKGVLSIGSNALTIDYTAIYKNPSTGAWDGTGTGTLAGSTSSILNIGSTVGGVYTAINPTLKFATNIAGAPYNNYLLDLNLVGQSTATLGNALNITGGTTSTPGCVTVGNTGTGLTTGGFLTLKSDANGTARIDQNTTGSTSYISGNVTIERFIQAHRAWRLLTAPINSSQTIFSSWQEGQRTTSPTVLANLYSGYGTEITNTIATPTTLGYDAAVTNNPSLLYYTGGPSAIWQAPTATNGIGATSGIVNAQQGYMLFIRGDRGVVIKTPPFNSATVTTLRTQGTLKETPGAITFASTGPAYQVVGNPFASAINFSTLYSYSTNSSNFGNQYVQWDPMLTGGQGVGAFVYFTTSGGHYTTNTTPASPFDTLTGRIESGSAFLLNFVSPYKITIPETAKATTSALVFRPADNTDEQAFRGNLYLVNADNTLDEVDGTLTLYDNQYSDSVNWLEDSRKLGNIVENMAIVSGGKLLAIEKRQPINLTDTISLFINNMKQQTYQFQFGAENLAKPGLTATLEDKFLGTSTPIALTGTVKINFTVTSDPASQGGSRFRIVFRSASEGPLPVTFTNVKASQQNKDIAVQWNVTNQLNIKQYEVEKSTDGTNFTQVNTTLATGNNNSSAVYNWVDDNVVAGDNYYRIVSVSNDAKLAYSDVVRIETGTGNAGITIYPNPVKDGVVGLQFTNMPKGNYNIRLLNTAGQEVSGSKILHTGGSTTQQMLLNKALAKGIYQLEIVKPDNTKTSLNILSQ